MVRLWKTGFVEPIEPPPDPIHLFVQQVLASVLQNAGVPLADAVSMDERLSSFRAIPAEDRERTVRFMLARGWLWDDSGILRIGPALVTSPASYNSKTHLAICCPITSGTKGYPFEVAVPPGLPIRGVILSDELKSLDWHVRQAEFIAVLSDDSLREVLRKAAVLVGTGG